MTSALVPFAAAGLLLAAELCSWLLGGRRATGSGAAQWIAWAAAVAAVAAGALACSALVLIAASPHVGRSVPITAAGGLAAVALVWGLGRSFRGGAR
jgi:hypothetical protein